MKQTEPVIHSDPEIMGGTPVFVGTRVPLATLLDYCEYWHLYFFKFFRPLHVGP
jgi:hypothetical protein